jgi:hypothetical protein
MAVGSRRRFAAALPLRAAVGAALARVWLTLLRRTLRAWRLWRGGRDNLFHGTQRYEDLLQLSIADLRRALGVPRDGSLRSTASAAHGRACAVAEPLAGSAVHYTNEVDTAAMCNSFSEAVGSAVACVVL